MLAAPHSAAQTAAASAWADFARTGYAPLKGFVGQDELATINLEVDRLARAPHDASCRRPHNTLLPLRWNDRLVELILESPDRVKGLRTVVEATDLRWISGYISIKEAHSEALWWHQDWWCWDHPASFQQAAPQVAVLCYLTGTDRDTGALRVLPGSHLKSTALHAVLPEAHESDRSPDVNHAAMRDHPEQITLGLNAGDAVVLDYRLLHGTHPNRRGSRRDCLLLSFAPSWRDLPEDLRGHLISHPAQPTVGERPRYGTTALLPAFSGPRKDLPLNRVPPAEFSIV